MYNSVTGAVPSLVEIVWPLVSDIRSELFSAAQLLRE